MLGLGLGAAITAQITQYAQTHDDAAQWLDAMQACGVWGYATYLVRRLLQAQEPPTTRQHCHDVLEREDTTHVQYGA